MMARRTFGSGVLGGLAILALGGCKLLGLSWTYRYRMTVEVDTPQGLKSGFAVREITYTKQVIKLPDMAGTVSSQRGEAVAVDLPNGQVLFALLSTDGYQTLQAAYGNDSPATLDAALSDHRVVELHPKPGSISAQSGYPMLVTFTDIKDPASVKLVDPADLAASFGPGVKLKRITVEITDDPVTSGIEKRLGWVQSHKGSLDYTGRLHPNAPEKDVTTMAFTQGISK